MVLTNAIHFKGQWEKAFGKHLTQKEDFHLLGGSAQKTVEMMHHPSLKMRHRSFERHAVIELPYQGGDVSMLILLPHANTAADLKQVPAHS
jgi:serpin B